MLISDWHDVLSGLEADSYLIELEQLRERLEVLDALDAGFGDFDSEPFRNDRNERIYQRVKAIRTRLETINAELYQSIRSEIMHGAQRHALLRWLQGPSSRRDKEARLRARPTTTGTRCLAVFSNSASRGKRISARHMRWSSISPHPSAISYV